MLLKYQTLVNYYNGTFAIENQHAHQFYLQNISVLQKYNIISMVKLYRNKTYNSSPGDHSSFSVFLLSCPLFTKTTPLTLSAPYQPCQQDHTVYITVYI